MNSLKLHDAGEVTAAVGHCSPVATTQIHVEPSDRNALNLQMALAKLYGHEIYIPTDRGGCEPARVLNIRVVCALPEADGSYASWMGGSRGTVDVAIEDIRSSDPERSKSSNASGFPKSESCSPSSPLPEGEEDSAPSAQSQSERTKDTTGQVQSI